MGNLRLAFLICFIFLTSCTYSDSTKKNSAQTPATVSNNDDSTEQSWTGPRYLNADEIQQILDLSGKSQIEITGHLTTLADKKKVNLVDLGYDLDGLFTIQCETVCLIQKK